MARKETVYSFVDSGIFDADFVLDKPKSAKAYFTYLLTRCLRMFEYKNLPDTIPADILDRYLMMNGVACIGKDQNDDLRVFFGNWGGEYDVYYRPSKFIVSNPHIEGGDKNGWFHTYTVFPRNSKEEQDGVLLRNDTAWFGLSPMLSRYATLFAENCLTIRTADIMLRIVALLSASTDDELKAAEEYMKAIENGKLKAIGNSPFFDGINLQSPPSNNGSYLTQFIELHQYLKGSFYNEVGLSANYNMKREAIGKGESTLDNDSLLPLCENMLMCRREDLKRVNELFNTSIEVDFSSSWKENQVERNAQLSSQLVQSAGVNMGNVGLGGVNMGQKGFTDNGRADDKSYTDGTDDTDVDSAVSRDMLDSNDGDTDGAVRQNDAASGNDRGTDGGAGKSEVPFDEDKQKDSGEDESKGNSERGDREGEGVGSGRESINDETLVDLTLEKINEIVEESIDDKLKEGEENESDGDFESDETRESEDTNSNPEK